MRSATFLAVVLALGGCSRAEPPGGSVPAPSAASVPLVAPSAASAVADASTPVTHAACDLARGFHGSVAGQEAFLRLVQKDGALSGRYFYAKVGVDIALHGAVGTDGAISLVEGDASKPTGRFKGGCDAHGAFSGEWSDDKKQHDFRFEPVLARDPPLVAAKRFGTARKVKTLGPFGMTTCEYDQTTFELFGAGTPEAERALNEIDATSLRPRILSPDSYSDASVCETGLTASFGRSAEPIGGGLVNVGSVGTYLYDGAAHPGNAVDFSYATHYLATGKRVTEKDLFVKFPAALVRRCLDWYQTVDGGYELGADADGHTFAIMPEGIHVFGTSYPHAAAVLTGRGPILTWSALRREGVLRPDSPARRAWEEPHAPPRRTSASIPPSAECAMDGDPI